MSSERDRRALKIFESTLGLMQKEREAFLAEHCGTDFALRSRVDALVGAHPSARSFLEHRPPAPESGTGTPTPQRLSAGEQLGNFLVEERLGAGGMGEVYRARDLRLERSVAIKVLSSHLAKDSQLRKRFLREALAISQLTHPRICTLYDVGNEDGMDFLVMELLDGETLAQELARGPLPLERALSTAVEIAEALEHAHAEGFIHRDLKPGNVMRTRSGIKVLDFGLAKSSRREPAEGTDPATLRSRLTTAPGLVLGTFAYMSPQQARGQPIDKQADIWAFGCVLYELITGRGVFGGETASDILVAVLEREPSWDTLPTSLPRPVRSLLTRCLQKDPARRLHDIADARIELEECLAGDATADVHDAPPTAVRPRRRWLSVCAYTFIVAALSALGTWSLVMPPGVAPPTAAPKLSIVPSADASFEFSGVAISPDGSQVTYVARDGGPLRLYLRRLDDFESSVVAGTEEASNPFFSPNGRALGYFTEKGLFTVSLHGGRPVHVCDAIGDGGVWGNDGTIVYTRLDKLWTVASVAGSIPALRDFEPEILEDYDMRWPSFLPGGKEVLVNSRSGVIRAVSLENGNWTEISGMTGSCARYLRSGYLVCVREDSLYAAPFDPLEKRVSGPSFLALGGLRTDSRTGLGHYAVSETGTLVYVPGGQTHVGRLVWRAPGEGEADATLEGLGAERYGQFRLSPSATRVALTLYRPRPQVRILDVATGRSFQLAAEASHPIWAPSGEAVYFRGTRDGVTGVYRAAARPDAPAELIVPIAGIGTPCSVSPGEKTLLYFVDAARTTRDDIWQVSLEDLPNEPELFIATPEEEWSAQFSPTGGWVAYASGENVFIAPFPEGQPRTPVGDGNAPLWSSSGDELYFRRLNSWLSSKVTTSPRLEVGKPVILIEGPYLDVNGYDYDYDDGTGRFLLLRSQWEDVREIRVISGWLDELRGVVTER